MDLCGPMQVAMRVNELLSIHMGLSCFKVKDELQYFKSSSQDDLNFDELTAMASEHSSSGPALHEMTPVTISSGIICSNSAVSTGSPSSTNVDQDAPSPSHSQTTPKTQPPVIPNDVEEDNHDIEIAHIALFYYYDAFLTSVEPKTYKDALTQSCWIEAIQEELNEFERLKNNPNHVYKLKESSYEMNNTQSAVYVPDVLSYPDIPRHLQRLNGIPTMYIRTEGNGYSHGGKIQTYEYKEGKAVDPSHYHGMIDTLLYLTASRPDLQFDICMCARYQARPTEKHLHRHCNRIIAGVVKNTIPKHIWYYTFFWEIDEIAGHQKGRKALRYPVRNWNMKYANCRRCCAQILWMRSQAYRLMSGY
ncbi:hypothetical protein Tco_0408685 [Tanacetum coccineum]